MSPRRPRVLLVEDSRFQARLIVELAEHALDIEWADRLSAALARLAAGGVDAVLLDLTLPDSWGIDTLRRLAAAHPAVPVILLSGGEGGTLAGEAARLGAAGFLSKDGVDGEKITGAVCAAMAGYRTGSRGAG